MSESDEQKNVRILLVDDHALVRRGMKGQFTINTFANYEVVMEGLGA